MVRIFLTTVIFAAFASTAAFADSYTNKAAEAMNICLNDFPDMTAARRGIRAAGFRQEFRQSGAEISTALGQNVLVLASYGGSDPRCGIGIDGVYDNDAIGFAQAVMVAKYGAAVQPIDISFERHLIAGWAAVTPHGTVVTTVQKQVNIPPIYRGSLISIELFN
jgi:ABC-type sulfate transport system substrate-binding protein